MKDTHFSLKWTSLLSVVKKSSLSNNHIESEKEKSKHQNINLKSLREENLDCPSFAKLNINYIRNKFQFLASQVINNVDFFASI